jgi:hypothetical protein
MIATILMLLALIASFALFGGLVRFSEGIIRPASGPSRDHLGSPTDAAQTAAEP